MWPWWVDAGGFEAVSLGPWSFDSPGLSEKREFQRDCLVVFFVPDRGWDHSRLELEIVGVPRGAKEQEPVGCFGRYGEGFVWNRCCARTCFRLCLKLWPPTCRYCATP